MNDSSGDVSEELDEFDNNDKPQLRKKIVNNFNEGKKKSILNIMSSVLEKPL